VETSLRDAFNIGYDVILVSDATASGNRKHYETTIERVRDYYGIVINTDDLKKMIRMLDELNEDDISSRDGKEERISEFLENHKLINVRKEKK
jgi:ureidoacrylate peracid hydrolase